MWLGIQSSVECGACGEKTAANAAVGAIHCSGCGAHIAVHPDLWASSLDSAAEQGATLDSGGVRDVKHHQQGAKLYLRLSRTGAKCPHCKGDLSAEHPHGPGEMVCPHCEETLGVRAMAGVAGLLVGEDRSLLKGQKRSDVAPEQVECPSCGTPVQVDGTDRSLTCGSCDSPLVVPDEVWRRVHAPGSVATWYVFSDSEGSTSFSGHLSFYALAIGDDGVVYAIGTHDGDERIFAFDTQRSELVWATPWEWCGGTAGVLVVGNTVWVWEMETPVVRGLDAATGQDQGTLSFDGARGLSALVDGGGGTLIACRYPEQEIVRVSTDGQTKPLWPPAGFFARIFGSNGFAHPTPVARPTRLAQGVGHLVDGRGGGVHLLTTGSGVVLGTVAADGSLARSTSLPLVISDGRARVAPDGTVHVLGGRSGESVWVRVRGADLTEIRVVPHSEVNDAGVGLISSVMGVGPDGDVWFGGTGGLERFDEDGKLKWSFVS